MSVTPVDAEPLARDLARLLAGAWLARHSAENTERPGQPAEALEKMPSQPEQTNVRAA